MTLVSTDYVNDLQAAQLSLKSMEHSTFHSHSVAMAVMVRPLDLQSRGFLDSRPLCCQVTTLGKYSHAFASVTKQYNLIMAKGLRSSGLRSLL